MKEVFLSHFTNVKPKYCASQVDLNNWLLKAHKHSSTLHHKDPNVLNDLSRYLVTEDFISNRFIEVNEIETDWEKHKIYNLTQEDLRGAPIEKRNSFFQKRAIEVFNDFFLGRKAPSHLIHVTCTGYISPSAGQIYFSNKAHTPSITHAYHMGCYASMPATRMARAFVASEQAETVDVAHTEMCSLHMDPWTHTAEQVIVQSLFADGHIVYRASSIKPQEEAFKILLIEEKLLPDSQEDMKWVTSQFGMQMALTREVPGKIAMALSDFITSVCTKMSIPWEQLQAESDFAIHPGGPKILVLAKDLLGLNDSQIKSSKDILFERGNMSSATLPHIWERILKTPSDKKYVLSLAFGPGLTIFGSVFERTKA